MKDDKLIRSLIITFYKENPETLLTAFEVAEKFSYMLGAERETRCKSVRDLKRTAKGTRHRKSPATTFIPTHATANATLYSSSYKEDFTKKEIEVTAMASVEPKSPQEIIDLHNIDTNLWKLTQYWSKQKSGGWQVSALFKEKQNAELTLQEIRDHFQEFFSSPEFTPYYIEVKPTQTNKKALFVYLSDKHIGAMTKKEAIYENEYNKEVFASRLQSVFEEITKTVSIHGRFEDIFICDLGDSVDGWNGLTTRGGHGLPQNMDNKEVFKTFVYEHKKFFDNLLRSGFANNYHAIMQTCDNHGGDFTYIVNEALSLYLTTAYPELQITIMDKFFEHFYYGEHCFIFTHGKDTEDLKNGLPLVLTPKAENFIQKYIDYHGLKMVPNIHLIKGDLHCESTQVTYDFRYRNVLSMYGASKWIMNNFGPNFAGVSFDIVEKHGSSVYSFYMKFQSK